MKHSRFAISLAAALTLTFGLTTAPAIAQQQLEEIVRIEVLDGGLTARGTHRAAVKLTLAKGWKTYWRSPGDAGIPPRFDWSDSQNVKSISLNWPTPTAFVLFGLRSIGYKNELVLPVEITLKRPGYPVVLAGTMELGVCEDICVPARLTFAEPLNPKAGRNAAIDAALADQPISASQAGVRSATCRLSPAGDGVLEIKAEINMPSMGGDEVTVIEPGNPKLWASETISSRKGKVLSATGELAHVSGSSFALDRSQVRITVLGKNRAVDIQGCTPG
jgi:DsbC/DsbD-like thiol-disulfide interchange protein